MNKKNWRKQSCLLVSMLLIFSLVSSLLVFADSETVDCEIVVEPQFDQVRFFSDDGYAAVQKDGKWGYIDKKGNWLVTPRYDYAGSFSEGKALCGELLDESTEEWNLMLMDTKGKTIELNYEDGSNIRGFVASDVPEDFQWDRFPYDLNNSYNYIMNEGHISISARTIQGSAGRLVYRADGTLFPILFWMRDYGQTFNDGVISQWYDGFGGMYVYDTDGNVALWYNAFIDEEGEYISKEHFYNGKEYFIRDLFCFEAGTAVAIVETERLSDSVWLAIVDKQGNIKYVSETDYAAASLIGTDPLTKCLNVNGLLCTANKEMLFGAVDMDGNVCVPFAYEDILPYHDGFIAVKKDGLWGYVDGKGTVVIEPQYERVTSFNEGRALALKDDKVFIINKENQRVPGYEKIDLSHYFSDNISHTLSDDGMVVIKENGKYGFARQLTFLQSDVSDGVVTIPEETKNLDLELGEVTGTITLDGVETLPETTIKATVNEVPITMEIPEGTKPGEMITALETPGTEEEGEHYLSAKFGAEGEEYDPAIEVTVEGGGEYELYMVREGNLTELEGENTSGNKVFALNRGGEVLLTRLKVKDTDATLKSLEVNGEEVQGFSSDKYNYIVKFGSNVKEVMVTAEANSPVATVEIEQASSIPGKATVTVIPEDESAEPAVYSVGVQYNQPQQTPTPTPTKKPSTSGGGGGSIGGGGGFVSIGSSNQSNQQSTQKEEEKKETVKPSRFTDIIGHWAEQDINEMFDEGIISGVTKTTFEPDRSITRAEFAALMTRALQLSAENKDSVFADVPENAWFADEVKAAAMAGLIVGYDGQFRPDDTITREEMAVVVMKAYILLGHSPEDKSIDHFSDKDEISAWAVPYVEQAIGSELISGVTGETFMPKENATRAQVASILKRLLNQ